MYYIRNLQQFDGDVKKTWRFLNNEFGRGSQTPQLFSENGSPLTNDIDKQRYVITIFLIQLKACGVIYHVIQVIILIKKKVDLRLKQVVCVLHCEIFAIFFSVSK